METTTTTTAANDSGAASASAVAAASSPSSPATEGMKKHHQDQQPLQIPMVRKPLFTNAYNDDDDTVIYDDDDDDDDDDDYNNEENYEDEAYYEGECETFENAGDNIGINSAPQVIEMLKKRSGGSSGNKVNLEDGEIFERDNCDDFPLDLSKKKNDNDDKNDDDDNTNKDVNISSSSSSTIKQKEKLNQTEKNYRKEEEEEQEEGEQQQQQQQQKEKSHNCNNDNNYYRDYNHRKSNGGGYRRRQQQQQEGYYSEGKYFPRYSKYHYRSTPYNVPYYYNRQYNIFDGRHNNKNVDFHVMYSSTIRNYPVRNIGRLIGTNGMTKNRIQCMYDVTIQIPQIRDLHVNPIKIEGRCEYMVKSAVDYVCNIVYHNY